MTTHRAGPHRGAPPDREPELTHYRDDGCRVWRSCLTCPLARCIYDEPRQGRGAKFRLRDAEVARLYREGWSARTLAQRYGIQRRSVFRILRRERGQQGEVRPAGRSVKLRSPTNSAGAGGFDTHGGPDSH